MEPASLVMERKMLRGIGQRVERLSKDARAAAERRPQRPRVLGELTGLPSAVATSSVEITPIGLRA